ncbi:MAG: hypothetical protein ACRERS_08790, partial [Methylococcales bacterium]
YTRDGVALTEEPETPRRREAHPTSDAARAPQIGKPTDFTIQQGLLALVGQDRHDVYALSGLVNARADHSATQVTLTIHSKMQAIARGLLQKQRLAENHVAALVVLGARNG